MRPFNCIKHLSNNFTATCCVRATILLAFLASVSGCTTRTISVPRPFDYCDRTVTLTREISNGRPSLTAGSFSTDDDEINAFVSCRNLSGSHTLRWDWYSPDNSLYSSKSRDFSTSSGKYSSTATAWHAIKIRGSGVEKLPGSWNVKVYYDETLIGASAFTVDMSSSSYYLPESSVHERKKMENTIIENIPFHIPKTNYKDK